MKHYNKYTLLLFFILLIFTQSAYSKEFQYSYIVKNPPISKNRYIFNINGVSAQIPYSSNMPLNSKNLKVTKLLLAIHSSNFNADMYLKNSLDLAKKMGKQDSTMVLAPQFLITSLLDKRVKRDFLYWEVPPFRASSKALYKNRKVQVSAYEILDDIVKKISFSGNFPNLKEIVVFGHSAGGQMVNRYAAYSNIVTSNIKIRYVVMAPSSYVYFNKQRYVKNSHYNFFIPKIPTKKYNRWGYGTERLYSVHKRNHVTAKAMEQQYRNAHVSYMVGSRDNNVNDSSLAKGLAAMLQGKHRLDRAIIYHKYLQIYFSRDIVKQHKLYIVDGVGHSSKGLMNSKKGYEVFFNKIF